MKQNKHFGWNILLQDGLNAALQKQNLTFTNGREPVSSTGFL